MGHQHSKVEHNKDHRRSLAPSPHRESTPVAAASSRQSVTLPRNWPRLHRPTHAQAESPSPADRNPTDTLADFFSARRSDTPATTADPQLHTIFTAERLARRKSLEKTTQSSRLSLPPLDFQTAPALITSIHPAFRPREPLSLSSSSSSPPSRCVSRTSTPPPSHRTPDDDAVPSPSSSRPVSPLDAPFTLPLHIPALPPSHPVSPLDAPFTLPLHIPALPSSHPAVVDDDEDDDAALMPASLRPRPSRDKVGGAGAEPEPQIRPLCVVPTAAASSSASSRRVTIVADDDDVARCRRHDSILDPAIQLCDELLGRSLVALRPTPELVRRRGVEGKRRKRRTLI